MSDNIFQNERNLINCTAGQTIFKEGDPSTVMYGVAEGEVDIFVLGKLAETTVAGQFFGEMALIDKEPRSAMAVAKSNCRLATIDEKRFLFLVQNTPFFAIEVMRALAHRLRRRESLS